MPHCVVKRRRRREGGAALRRFSRMQSLSAGCGCSILPPDLLRRIARNGSSRQRDDALATLGVDHTLRLARATYDLLDARTGRGLFGITGAGKQRSVYDAHGTETLPGRMVR